MYNNIVNYAYYFKYDVDNMNSKTYGSFIWDIEKENANIEKYKVDFITACKAFNDKNRIIAVDEKHSEAEQRYFCIGKVNSRIVTVRFIKRGQRIRIFGAGYWRKGVNLYEKTNKQ